MYRGPDEDYQGREICFGSNETALSIADVTDKQNPVALSMAEYPNVGYTHQGWLTEDQRYLYIDDELDELNGLVDNTRTLVWDVSDLDDPVLVKEFLNPNTTADRPQPVRQGRQGVPVELHVAGSACSTSRIPTSPSEVGFFDTVPFGDDDTAVRRLVEQLPVLQERRDRRDERVRGAVPAPLPRGRPADLVTLHRTSLQAIAAALALACAAASGAAGARPGEGAGRQPSVRPSRRSSTSPTRTERRSP